MCSIAQINDKKVRKTKLKFTHKVSMTVELENHKHEPN
jgi:hypothetical protein